MTNDVVQTFTANVLLAIGASPAMVIDPTEAAQFAAIADALLINVGTLTTERANAMRAAAERPPGGKTRTLDPVAVGALTLRTDFVANYWNCGLRRFAVTPRKSWRWRGAAAAGAAWTRPIA